MADTTSETKVCPQCGETIKAQAVVCRFCRATFEVVRRGYCPHCRQMATATADGTCSVCATPLIDLRVESHPTTASLPAAPLRVAPPSVPTAAVSPAGRPARRPVRWGLVIGLVVIVACVAVAAFILIQMNRPAVARELTELTREMDGDHVIVTGEIYWGNTVRCTMGEYCNLGIAAADGSDFDLPLWVPFEMIVGGPTVGVQAVEATEGADIHDGDLVKVTGFVNDCAGDDPDCYGVEAEEIVLVQAGIGG
jgi:hypothetical protein